MVLIEVSNLKKSYGKLDVLKQITFDVNKNDVIAVIGPSGSGKSTMLRSLVHLEEIDGGSICISGDYLVKDGIYSKPQEIKRITSKMGMVFQHFNLFPHLSVKENLELAPRLVKKELNAEIERRSTELLKKIGLSDRASAYPAKLSGGQKQRVAIARALEPPYTEPYVRWCERTGVNRSLLLDYARKSVIISRVKAPSREGRSNGTYGGVRGMGLVLPPTRLVEAVKRS